MPAIYHRQFWQGYSGTWWVVNNNSNGRRGTPGNDTFRFFSICRTEVRYLSSQIAWELVRVVMFWNIISIKLNKRYDKKVHIRKAFHSLTHNTGWVCGIEFRECFHILKGFVVYSVLWVTKWHQKNIESTRLLMQYWVHLCRDSPTIHLQEIRRAWVFDLAVLNDEAQWDHPSSLRQPLTKTTIFQTSGRQIRQRNLGKDLVGHA